MNTVVLFGIIRTHNKSKNKTLEACEYCSCPCVGCSLRAKSGKSYSDSFIIVFLAQNHSAGSFCLCQKYLERSRWSSSLLGKWPIPISYPYPSALDFLHSILKYLPYTVFPHIVAAATILFWIHKSLKISNSFLIKFSLM